MTKVDIFSGFLGAGKTTLIKKLIEEAYKGEQIVLIENEFGEIGIDGGFLKDAGVQINEMNSGCICCSLVGDFGKALDQVINEYAPDRILIEPSGVGKLSDVILAVERLHNDKIQLNGFTTVVDAKKAKMYMKNFGEFFNNQIEHASSIILSHTAGLSQDKLDACVALMREHNQEATIVTTPWEEITGQQILATMEQKNTIAAELAHLEEEAHDHEHHHHDHDEECHAHHHDHDEECHEHHHGHDEECHEHHHHDHDEECHGHHHHDGCGHEHHHHHADEVFTSWGLETIVPVTHEQLEDVLKRLSTTREFGDVLRAKGMLPTENPGEWLYFDLVPEQYEIRQGRPDYTGKVCVIGASLKEEELNSVFGRG